jgi:tetratricopeptide (TPR) repeat protein
MTAAELRARGNAALGEGRLDEAREFYRQAAVADPKDAVPWLNMGFVNLESGRMQEAEECLARAILLAPPGADYVPDAHFLLGRVHQARGAPERALAEYQAAAAAREGFAEPMESAAQLLLGLKRYDEALDQARRSAALRANPQTDLIVAQALDKLDKPQEAIVVLDALLAQHPDLTAAIEGRGVMLLRANRAEEALVAFQRVLSLEGESAARLSNEAVALHRMGRFDEAVALAQRAFALDPDRRDEAYNLAAVLLEMLRTDEAMEILERVSKRYPDDADLGWNLAIGHLLRGELVEGFAAYEHRFLCDAFGWRKPAPDFGRPRWSGRESLAGKSILLFAEQGLGDSIQLLRYVPRVASAAGQVLLRLPRALIPLLKDLPANCRWVSESDPAPPTDFQCPLMSLPNAFVTTLETLPADVPYITADPVRVKAWRERLEALGEALRVGIVWSGNASHPNDRNRSIPLAMFKRIAVPGVQYVSLQPEVRASDRAAYDGWAGLARFGEELKDFADTAALVCALDLVVTVDTSVAHVTGALGQPVWVLLPHYPDWRWLLGRDDSPWYPSMRLWRQPVPRDWPAVLDGVRGELERVKGIEPSS